MDFDAFLNGEAIDISGNQQIKKGNDYIENAALPYISDERSWSNYTDQVTYETDKLMRTWLEEMSHDTTWMRDRRKRKYRFSQIFRILYGREWDSKEDGPKATRIRRVFSYYSTSLTTTSKDDSGKWGSKTGYVVSAARLKNPPYSLKLRFEWLLENGVTPTAKNMKLPKDDLEVGHSRNPKTDSNMERRRQQKRERYNEYQRERNSKLKAK